MRAGRTHFAFLLWLMLAVPGMPAMASELRPFVPGSLAGIVATRGGKPFILTFWSLTCSHCRDELALFSRLKRQYPSLDVVLVSTDTPEDIAAIQSTLEQIKLTQVESWVFADSFAERLRFEVDKKWHGELPRSYFYRGGQIVSAVSGKLDSKSTEQWVRQAFTGRKDNNAS